ncbi:cytochrome P450 4C1-like isoform X1 [Schistocerca cancellata]|uniref:cytochrome P450 4C1-like isoform X1 n=1 Tax=Schistocerca cancellata TaxID=274614 RepID=UPI002117AAE2|nr:cytochrome P450 4C1-like isoform X1 [Schistocerca cancellata]
MAWWPWLMVQLVVSCCAGLVAVLWWKWATKPHIDAPGPPTLPIIGNILDLLHLPLTLRKMFELHRQYGDLTRLYVGPMLLVLVAHPDDVQHILLTSKLVDRGTICTNAMRMFLGDGLVTIDASRWKVHRKLINPTFHSEILQGFLDAFHDGGLFVCERFARTRGAATEVHPPVLLAAIRNFFSTVIGMNPELFIADTFPEEEVSASVSYGVSIVQKMIFRPWMQSKFLLQLTSKGRGLLRSAKMLHNRALKCIAIRSAATEDGPTKTRQRLLEALIKPGGQTAIPLDEVQGEFKNLLMAGTETTAVTVSYVLPLLALHPEWQDAAHQELKDVFGEGDDYLRAPSLADLGRLRVLESIIKETLRLFPTVPMLPRVATEDIWLSGGSAERVSVPKGTLLFVLPFLTHRLPQFFQDPQRFDPSRFLEDRVGKEHACSYLPFGLGARNCVGSQYGRLQLKVYLADILRRFRFLPCGRREDLEDSALSFSLSPIKPVRVSCVPVDGPKA